MDRVIKEVGLKAKGLKAEPSRAMLEAGSEARTTLEAGQVVGEQVEPGMLAAQEPVNAAAWAHLFVAIQTLVIAAAKALGTSAAWAQPFAATQELVQLLLRLTGLLQLRD